MGIVEMKNSSSATTYCYEGIWTCEDTLHDCPGRCGYIIYIDSTGNQQEINGICIGMANTTIEAQTIIEATGVQTTNCTPVCESRRIAWTGINPGDTGIVEYLDCNGIQTSVSLTWEESNGNSYAIDICTKGIISINQFAQDLGLNVTQNCVPPL